GAWLADLMHRSGEYNGFNLVLGDGESLWYFGSREGLARPIPPGVHGLSNHLLDEPWPKVVRACTAMQAALEPEDPAAALFDALSDREVAPDASLPATGVGLAWDAPPPPALLAGVGSGTRPSTVVLCS